MDPVFGFTFLIIGVELEEYYRIFGIIVEV